MSLAGPSRAERLAPTLAGIAVAAPMFVFAYSALGDLPMHEALVAILRHRDEAWFAPAGLYEVVAPQANQLFHWLAYLLSFGLGVTLACKAVVAASIVAIPAAAGHLLGRLGRTRWPAVLLAPVAVGWTYRFGLAPNLLGLALFVAGLSLVEALARRQDPRRVALTSIAMMMVFFAHESSALALALVVSYVAVVRGGTRAAVAQRLVPAAVALVLAVLQQRVARGLVGANMQAVGSDYGLDPVARLAILPGAIFGGYDAARLAVIGLVWLLGLLACGAARGRPVDLDPGVRVALWRYRHAVLAAAFFFLYLGFPMMLGGTSLLAHRFLPPAATLLVLAVAPRKLRGTVVPVLVAAAPVAMLAIALHSMRVVDRSFRDLDEVLGHLPDGAAVAQLDLTPRARGRIAPVPGAANRALTRHGGRMLFAFTDSPPNPVYIREDARWEEPIVRLMVAPFAFMPSWDLPRFGYVLVREERHDLAPLLTAAFAPEAEPVASAGDWILFRATAPQEPIDAPDRAVPTPPPETLADRLKRLRAPSPAPVLSAPVEVP
ncbi:MAG: hypothetical protein JWP97_1874 [Labilithrix sp.]|nr:hypothetical protein [Labilithrix sp.]